MRGNGTNGNGTRRPAEIQAEINRTRNELDQTLTAIEHRLTPGQLLDQGIDYLRHSGAKQYLTNLGGSVKDNPMPVTLVGIGLAWLAAMQNRPVQYRFVEVEKKSTGYEGYGGITEGTDAARQKLAGTMDAARDKMHHAGEHMTDMKNRVADRASDMKGRLTDRASQMADTARSGWESARGGWSTMVNEHPLALGAIGLAIGAVAAAMQPRTRREDEMMGATRDRVLDQAKQAGAEKLQQAQQVAKQAVAVDQPQDAKSSEERNVSGDSTLNPPSFVAGSGVNLDNGPARKT
ncbi:MAG TPA: DUF3618 domain-containing protein [Burkholderiales bacterium]|nr:DUF3618 domain-containing protein [Burkholderiales bacterium]